MLGVVDAHSSSSAFFPKEDNACVTVFYPCHMGSHTPSSREVNAGYLCVTGTIPLSEISVRIFKVQA